MTRLEGTTTEDLRGALATVEGKRPTMRLMVAIAHKSGVDQSTLAAWYGVERKTIYNWLTRIEELPLERAVRDAERTGRPRKLSDAALAAFRETVRGPPAAAGYDAEEWTASLVRRHVREAHGVDYSLSSCRRLLREATG